MIAQKRISVIAPTYNEEENIKEFIRRLKDTCNRIGYEYEIIIVDDGGNDRTAEIVRQLAKGDDRIKLLSFSRNFGQPAAISAGLTYASGDGVIIMDADLQDKPEDIEFFIKKWEEEYDVVFAVRKKRKEGLAKISAYWMFYRILQLFSPTRIPLDSGDFSLIDRKVVDAINKMPERNRFIRGLRAWTGFCQIGIDVERDARFAGKPKYTLRKLIKLATDGIFSFSYLPLRFVTWLGFIIALSTFVAIIVLLYLRIFTGVLPLTGFTSMIIAILFLGGIQLIAIGLLGEYIGRIYDEVKKRPLYFIKEKIGFDL